jgi:L-asparaginase
MRGVLDSARLSANGLPAAELVSVSSLASAELSVTRLAALSEQLRRLVDVGACGAVITMGTDTLEEAAFVLDLLWDRDEPLVVVGAMRHGALPGSDGPANLRDALRIAAHPRARGHGVLVAMSGQIHHAWQVRKAHTGILSSFQSAVSGPAGSVQEETVRMTATSVVDRPHFRLDASAAIPPVALLRAVLGDDGRLLEAIGTLGYGGLVVEAMGGGSVPPTWAPKLQELLPRMPVVYSPRPFTGPALRSTYGGVGAELHLRRMGMLPTGLLDGLKSRLLLGLLLATASEPDAMRRAFIMFDFPTSNGDRPTFGPNR